MKNCQNWQQFYDYEEECNEEKEETKKKIMACSIILPIVAVFILLVCVKFRLGIKMFFKDLKEDPRKTIRGRYMSIKDRLCNLKLCEYFRSWRRTSEEETEDETTEDCPPPTQRYQATRPVHRVPSDEEISRMAREQASRLIRPFFRSCNWWNTETTNSMGEHESTQWPVESGLNEIEAALAPKHTSTPAIKNDRTIVKENRQPLRRLDV